MGWKRLPTYFLNLPLRLLPLSEKQKKAFESTGHLTELAFKTTPSTGKFEIKECLEKVYGLQVSRIRTLNYEGRKKGQSASYGDPESRRRRTGFFRRADYKKAYVTLKPPTTASQQPQAPAAVPVQDQLPVPTGPTAQPAPAAYVSYREVKGPPAPGRNKKTSYVKRFYLIDSHGNERLAATGEDQGDAHYIYRSADGFERFGGLDCHNRRELVAWLDRVKRETQDAAGFRLVEDPPDESLAASPVGSPVRHACYPPFVAYRQERFAHADGHRGQRWFLVDESGHEQLAVTAEERETRDGHYTYKAEGPLANYRPLVASNMGMVQDWLDQMVTHPMEATQAQPGLLAGANTGAVPLSPAAGHAGQPVAPAVPAPAPQQKRKPPSTEFQPPAKKSGKRALDSGHLEDAKRQKLQALEGTEAGDKELSALRLREIAAREAVRRKSACRAALEWLQPTRSEVQGPRVESCVDALRGGVADLNGFGVRSSHPVCVAGGSGGSRRPHAPSRPAALVDTLEALRGICGSHFTAPTLARTNVAADLAVLQSHEESCVAELAKQALQQIKSPCARHVTVLTQPRFLVDPLAAAEATLAAAAVRFAAKAPAPQPESLVRGLAAQLQQALQHGGSPVGAPTPTAMSQHATPPGAIAGAGNGLPAMPQPAFPAGPVQPQTAPSGPLSVAGLPSDPAGLPTMRPPPGGAGTSSSVADGGHVKQPVIAPPQPP